MKRPAEDPGRVKEETALTSEPASRGGITERMCWKSGHKQRATKQVPLPEITLNYFPPPKPSPVLGKYS